MKKIISLIALLMALPLPAMANRISAPASPGVRCLPGAPSKAECSEFNKWALDTGCITQEEFDTLARFGSVASCSLDIHNRTKYILIGWCSCGCFAPETPILTNHGYLAAKTVADNFATLGIVNLNSQSRLLNPQMNISPIRNSTAGPEEKPLVVIQTDLGQVLRVTDKHAVLTSEGKMVQARNLKVGDGLVTLTGKIAKVVALGSRLIKAKVVNFAVEAENPAEHIIVANDILVGDLLWQSSLEDMQNQILVRQ